MRSKRRRTHAIQTSKGTCSFLNFIIFFCEVKFFCPLSQYLERKRFMLLFSVLRWSGLWGWQCKSSMIAKENCALRCLSPICYDLIYESDPVSSLSLLFRISSFMGFCTFISFPHNLLFLFSHLQLEEGEKDYIRGQEYKYCMHR